MVRVLLSIALLCGLVGLGWGMGGGEGAGFARVAQLVGQIEKAEPGDDIRALVTEAVSLVGFAVWSPERTVVRAAVEPRTRLAVTTGEIEGYSALYLRGDTVRLGDLLGGMEAALGVTGLGGPVLNWLNDGFLSTEELRTRRLLYFIRTLGPAAVSESPRRFETVYSLDSELNAIEAWLIMRVLTEEVRSRSVVRGLAGGGALERVLGGVGFGVGMGLGQQSPAPGPLGFIPGYVEDGIAGAMGLINGELPGVSQIAKLNLATGALKFIMTYSMLSCETEVEGGNPLVRRRDTQPGNEKTLKARVFIDGTKATDVLKDFRLFILATGLDVDAPKSGPVAGIETEWRIGQNGWSNDRLIQVKRGQGDISKIVTGEDGVARIVVEGAARSKAISQRTSRPEMKRVWVHVKPQAKSTEIKQDAVDALFGALGVLGGVEGVAGPIMETLYRMKWSKGFPLKLEVKDWAPAEMVASGTVEVEGSATRSSRSGMVTRRVSRSFEFAKVPVQVSEAPELPPLDPDVKKFMSAEQIASYEQARVSARETPISAITRGGVARYRVDDLYLVDQDTSDCVKDRLHHWETWQGGGEISGRPFFTAKFDLKTQEAEVTFGTFEVDYRFRTSTLSGKREEGGRRNPMQIFDNLRMPGGYTTKVPFTVRGNPNDAGDEYFEISATIPFEFQDGGKGSARLAIVVYRRDVSKAG